MTKLYSELADWWHVMSSVDDYVEESAFYRAKLQSYTRRPIRSVLELGSGGGNNAFHLKTDFAMTLVDLSPQMIEQSKKVNPELEHHVGDMRIFRCGRTFDAVFVHDAVSYMTSLPDLLSAMQTAYVHCQRGGAALFAPDHTRETYRPDTDCGGHDVGGRAMRYLEWDAPSPDGKTHATDYIYAMRTADGHVVMHHDRHHFGLFSQAEWHDTLSEVGFEPHMESLVHSEVEAGTCHIFIGVKT